MKFYIKKVIKKLLYTDFVISLFINSAAFIINIYNEAGRHNFPRATNKLKKSGLSKVFNYLTKEYFDDRLIDTNLPESKNKNCLIFLLHGIDLIPVFENSLISLKKNNILIDKVAYCEAGNENLFMNVCKKYNVKLIALNFSVILPNNNSARIGTKLFNSITKNKWSIILKTFSLGYDNVIYADVDIVFFRNFIPYINKVSKIYKCGIQRESVPTYPANCCTGFMYFNKSAKKLLKKLFLINKKHLFQSHDQDMFNYIYLNSKKISKEFFIFPDSLFQCGLLYKTHLNKKFTGMAEDLKPYLFHTNFIIGIKKKIKMLKFLSLWFVNKKNK